MDFIDRMKQEKNDLIHKLNAAEEGAKKLSGQSRELLLRQIGIMEDYIDVLGQRIRLAESLRPGMAFAAGIEKGLVEGANRKLCRDGLTLTVEVDTESIKSFLDTVTKHLTALSDDLGSEK